MEGQVFELEDEVVTRSKATMGLFWLEIEKAKKNFDIHDETKSFPALTA